MNVDMVSSGRITIREVGVPSSVDEPDFRATVDIANAVIADVIGHDLLSDTYEETFPHWQPSQYWEIHRFLAEVDGRPVGRAYLNLPQKENLDQFWVNIAVLPEFRRRGVGTALLQQVRKIARAQGRSVCQTFATTRPGPGEVVAAKTGFGAAAADAPGTRFLLGEGFVLEQIERMSRLDLVRDHHQFEEALAQARLASEPDYRVVTWEGRTPEDRLDDAAWMHSRMSTDAPQGDLEIDEEVWDAERVTEVEARNVNEDRFMLTAAAEHVATGRLVAYTVLSVPLASDRVAYQEDTLVTREHRGHRLGMLVKAANLVALATRQPEVPAVLTWNAEENRPMLDVNEALGFRAEAYEGIWQLRLASDR